MATKHAARGTSTGGSSSKSGGTGKPRPDGRGRAGAAPRSMGGGKGLWALVVGGVAVVLVALVVGFGLASGSPGPSAGGASGGTVIQANGGQWTDISPDTLSSMMGEKDFTLLNVKTPYIGEIDGTDLYIPYTDLTARASELPADKEAKIVVYCRTGNESAVAAQTLIDLGYTNIDNLDGGMTAWVASGRSIVQRARS